MDSTLSIYILSRSINFGDFIQRIDAIFILIWIMSIFSYLAIVMYFALKCFKKTFNIEHTKPMCYSFASIIFVISMLSKNFKDFNFFENVFYRYASIIFVFLISMAVLISGYIKKKHELRKGDVKT